MASPFNEREEYAIGVPTNEIYSPRHATTVNLGEAAMQPGDPQPENEEIHPDDLPLPDDEKLAKIGEYALEPVREEIAAETDRSHEIFRLERDSETYEVSIESDLTLEDYEKITTPEDMALMKEWAKTMEGKTVTFLNPTMEGGGVAIMRPAVVHLMRELGVDAHWYVMEGQRNEDEPNPFLFTKQMHNTSQRMNGDERISEEGKDIHRHWNQQNAEVLMRQKNITNADVLVVDDPQPAWFVSYVKENNPDVKIVWRNHIDTDENDEPGSPQEEVKKYVLNECGVKNADAVVAHPVEGFVYPEMSDKTYFAPATIEMFDDLNRELSAEEIKEGIDDINNQIIAKNEEFIRDGRLMDVQSTLDPDRKKLTLIARFDESKGMDIAMELGSQVREEMLSRGVPKSELPQIVIIGNGSVDDPSGVPMYEKMLEHRREQYSDIRDDIVVMRLTHNYMAMNAAMYESDIGLQMSEAEGCETRITDWIKHGIPTVIANRGGMPSQVVEGHSGYILDQDQPDKELPIGAALIASLLTDRRAYDSLRKSTLKKSREFNERDFSTQANVTRLLRVCHNVLSDKPADRKWHMGDLPHPD